MRRLKVGDRMGCNWRRKERREFGFTLLELLMVIMLMGILSFSVIYGFGGSRNEPMKRGEEIILKLMKVGRRSAIIEECEVGLMVMKENRRFICLKVGERSFYELLPEGVEMEMRSGSLRTVEEEVWEYKELKAGRENGVFLVLVEDRGQRVGF